MNKTMEKIKQQARDSWSGPEGEKRASDVEKFIKKTIKQYSEKLSLPEADILEAIEKNRSYSVMNFYQESNFPKLDGDVVIYNTLDDLKNAVSEHKFRCPCCSGISTDPYTCNSGKIIDASKNKKCDWKSFGLFKTLGKGYRFTIKEGFLEKPCVDEIFMPIQLEKQNLKKDVA